MCFSKALRLLCLYILSAYSNNSQLETSSAHNPQRDIWQCLLAQTVKNLPAMKELQVRSLSQEDPLEKRMAIHSTILAWRIPQTEEPGEQSMGSQRMGDH